MVTIADSRTRRSDGRVGLLLRHWRRQRRLSQMELALDAGVSTRHLSFVETGRSRPSAEMVLHLAEQLQVPLRERNELLLTAGYAPRFEARTLDDPELAPVRDALGHVLAGHEPYPAIAVDRQWNLVASNSALDPLLEGIGPELLVPPVNVMRLALHPDGLARRIINLGEWRGHLLDRLARQIRLTGDAELAALYDEMLGYPGRAGTDSAQTGFPERAGTGSGDGPAIMVQLKLAPVHAGDGVLSFFSTVTTFGTAVEVTVSELSVEAFFPADAETAARLRP
jgi:transcriptional regulator with XRE-family HTH domain